MTGSAANFATLFYDIFSTLTAQNNKKEK